MSRKYTEIIGWYGVVAILLAYGGNTFGFMPVDTVLYLILNLTGGLAIGIDAWKQKNYQPVVLNSIWVIVALIGIVRALL